MTNKILTVILKHNIIRIDFLKIIKGGEFMTLKHIKIFIAVCDTGSMTAASKQLYIAQPAVSFAIAEMENYYGQKLFDRISNRLYITEAGKQFLEYSRQISSLFDEMEDKIKNWDTIGVLRIGANTTIGAYTLPYIIKNFKQTHPDVIVETTIEHTAVLENLILNNKLDIAITEIPSSEKLILSEEYMENNMLFLCSPEHPWAGQTIPIADLNHSNFIMRDQTSEERKVIENFLHSKKIHINIVWESLSQQSILNAVSNNLGIAILSSQACKIALSEYKVSIFHVENFKLKNGVYILRHQNKILTNLMQDFINLISSSNNELFF